MSMQSRTARWGATAVLTLAGIASGANVGINFVGTGNSTDSIGSSQVAGVLPQVNWNNLSGKVQTGVVLSDNLGQSGYTLSYSASSNYNISSTTHTAANASNGDQVLNNGALYTGGTTTPTTVTVANLHAVDASGLTVYAYFLTDHAAGISLTLTPYVNGVAQTAMNYVALTPGNPAATGYVDGTTASGFTYSPALGGSSTTSATAGADYAVFSLPATVNQFTLSESLVNSVTGNVATNGALSGVQIVNVIPTPEPASLTLLGIGAVGLLARRRRTA